MRGVKKGGESGWEEAGESGWEEAGENSDDEERKKVAMVITAVTVTMIPIVTNTVL